MKNTLTIIAVLSLFISCSDSKISEWRPENRTGVSAETGLMTTWPEDGPEQLWSFEELPVGYSSPSFNNSAMFITGTKDSLDILVALDMHGKLLWQKPMGRAWNGSYPDSRATPTVEGNRVYTCSGFGDINCFDAKNGEVVWSYNASEDNKGTYGIWGIAESLLIDAEKVYFTPGGPETTTIALDKKTGKIVWKSKSLDDQPTYVSPIMIEYAGVKTIVNTTMKHIFAVNAENGEIRWTVDQITPEGFNPKWEVIKCVTPLYKDRKVYVTTGYNVGAMMVEMNEAGDAASVAWTDSVLDVHHGGAVLLDGYIYGSNWLNNGNGNWCCIEWETGKKMWEEHWKCKGSIIAAENMLYMYDEKRGFVGLAKATTEKFEIVSSFQVKQGSAGPFWAHPVIHNKVLYLRHSNALMAYDIKK